MHMGQSLEEGKKGMNIEVYRLMCTKLMEMETEDAVFAHLFLILEWNLMARSDDCTKLKFADIEWRNDCHFLFWEKNFLSCLIIYLKRSQF